MSQNTKNNHLQTFYQTHKTTERSQPSDLPEPIAIIGMGCRFPGDADSPEAFWKLMCDGVDAISEVPAERWNLRTFYDQDRTKPGKTYTRWGGFVNKIDQFDPQFFGISPREAAHIDPQQRLLLEVSWEALEDAGLVPELLAKTNVGVFVGLFMHDYAHIQASPSNLSSIAAHTGTGMSMCIAANRISYAFDFMGPSLAIDTACSSSLVAVHLACQSIRSGECEVALVGGANALLKPESTIVTSKASMLSPDGRCKSFDARANGYVRSEGAGIVVLKSLSSALADGDPIYAVIRGSAVNQDGHTKGITVPNGSAQKAVLQEAYRQAGVSPVDVQYIEAHGTGTAIGDPTEANAIGTIIGGNRADGEYCIIGSAKSNIGHLEAAAGVAGLIKAALMLKHGQIPPNLHFETPNPKISFERLRLRVPTSLEPWHKNGQPRLAGVNSFGFGGTNAHVVLEEAPSVRPLAPRTEEDKKQAYLLPLSARTSEALHLLAKAYLNLLLNQESNTEVSLSDICYSATLRRGHHPHRLALVAHSKEELVERLQAFLASESDKAGRLARLGISFGRQASGDPFKLLFVFSGMGPQWWAMGRQLLQEEPIFREVIERCDALLQPYTNWSLLAELTAEEEQSRINETQVAQPAIFALQVGLATLWRSWGVQPDGIVGHSVGEVAAAHVAGALSLEDAIQVIFHRSRLQQQTAGTGTMLAVGLPLEKASKMLAGYEELLHQVSIGAINSPHSVTLAGESEALEQIQRILAPQDIFCRFLQVEVPYHSPQMAPIKAELLASLQKINPQSATIPLFSTVTGQAIDGQEMGAAYWWQNVREPVRLAAVMDKLIEANYDLFLEVAAHPVLARSMNECIAHATTPQRKAGAVLPSLRRRQPERAMMLGTVGQLYTLGYPLDWKRFYPKGGRFVPLPSYPWQRERYWNESEESMQIRLGQGSSRLMLGQQVHPLLGSRLKSAQPTYSVELDRQQLTYLDDHRVQNAVVYPAAAYVEMALATAKETSGEAVLREVKFEKALFLPDHPVTLQLILNSEQSAFDIYSNAKDDPSSWTRHMSGKLHAPDHGFGLPAASPSKLDEIRRRFSNELPVDEYYQHLEEIGFQYGPSFQGIRRIWGHKGEALAEIQLPDELGGELEYGEYGLHPVILDSCFQATNAAISLDGVYMPVQIDLLRVHRSDLRHLWCYARLREENPTYFIGDIQLFDDEGTLLVEIQGMRCQFLEGGQRTVQVKDHLYEYQWQPAESVMETVPPQEASSPGSWLIFADREGVGEQLAERLQERGEVPILVWPGEPFNSLEPDRWQIRPEQAEDMQRLFERALSGQPACRGVVHLWSLDVPSSEDTTLTSLEASHKLGVLNLLHLVQALASRESHPRLWLVTRGSQAVGSHAVSVAQSPLWGLGRVIVSEQPHLRTTMVDLSPDGPTAHNQAQNQNQINALFAELWSDDKEDEIAWRDKVRYVHRLRRVEAADIIRIDAIRYISADSSQDQPFHLEITSPGTLESLALRATTHHALNPGEVELEICATALNFKDIAKVMNWVDDASLDKSYFGRALGSECVGKIVALGEGVTGYEIGDEVIALTHHSFGRYSTTDARFMVPKPAQLTDTEATTLPMAFITAYYTLHHLGRIKKGERVLIHTASGGVGLAAIQIAQQVGAEILATAGTPEKRQFLRSLGVKHVMNSRSLAFADEVMELTLGSGVDIVLNSLPAEAMTRSLSLLRAGGRFIELTNVHSDSKLELRPFQKGLSFFAFDLSQLMRSNPDYVGALFREAMQYVEAQGLQPLPHRLFPISEVVDAFRYMAQAKHIGKIVVSLQDLSGLVLKPTEKPITFRADGTYLITGGFGGFGLAVAKFMVEHGARHLVLMSRSGMVSEERQLAVKALQEAGAEVFVAEADVTQKEQIASTLLKIKSTMPPVRGVIHSAMVLDDAILLKLNQERMKKVMGPKVSGAWNLHTLTLHMPLDFFVLFSSISSMIGNPGQGNYVAGNAFLDALAHYRQSLGLPALSINWGAIGDVGVVAKNSSVSKHLERIGIQAVPLSQALTVLGQLLQQDVAQIGVAPLDWQRWGQIQAGDISLRFSHLVGTSAQPTETEEEGGLISTILAAEPAEREQLLGSELRQQVASVLGTSAAKLSVFEPLLNLGLDSLMAVELRNWVKTDLGVDIPMVKFMEDLTVSQMTTLVSEQLSAPASAKAPAPSATTAREVQPQEAEQLLAQLDQLTSQEMDALLNTMLSEKEITHE